MATNIQRSYVANEATQTEFVVSPILWQCLYIIQTVSEFQNLTYRVSKTHSGLETLVVYREGISGIFGPAIDPLTLTLDPSGRCLVNILFKAAQHVTIVAKGSGCIELASLMAVLRMISGKGYLFCSGIPEKFLAGKAWSNHVILHRNPFKRYQSVGCPVYYVAPASHRTIKTSQCVPCPYCIQAAKRIQGLPLVPRPSSNSVLHKSNHTVEAPAESKLDNSKERIKDLRMRYDRVLKVRAAEPSTKSKNTCRLCKKQFSSDANLLNHLQRHEGLYSSKFHHLCSQKSFKSMAASYNLSKMFRRSYLLPRVSFQRLQKHNKRLNMSQTSLKLFQKYVDEVFLSVNNGSSKKRKKKTRPANEKSQGKSNEARKKTEEECPSLTSPVSISVEKEGLKRSLSGISAMQTLLEAAAIANKNCKSSSMPPFADTISSMVDSSEKNEKMILPPRKKRKRSSIKETEVESQDSSLLTNLNLLSTVSIQTAMQENPLNQHVQNVSSTATPTAKNIIATRSSCTSSSLPSKRASSYFTRSTASDTGHQQKEQSSAVQNGRTSERLSARNDASNVNLPPVPPLFFAGNINLDQTFPVAHGSATHSSSKTNNPSTASGLHTVPITAQCINSNLHKPSTDCGAIDLSKPKQHSSFNIPSQSLIAGATDKDVLMSTKSPTSVPAGHETPTEIMRYLMMASSNKNVRDPTTETETSSQCESLSSHIIADQDLQARIFASARNYTLDKNRVLGSSGQVQAVIASSTRVIEQKKKSKLNSSSGKQGGEDEIQCGYKWSGSGGLVKERTHMVQELIPTSVMNTYLSLSTQPLVNSQPHRSSASSQPSAPAPQTPSPPFRRVLVGGRSQPPPGILNLSTSRHKLDTHLQKKQMSRRQKKVAEIPPELPVSPGSPGGSAHRGLLITSLMNPLGSVGPLMGGSQQALSTNKNSSASEPTESLPRTNKITGELPILSSHNSTATSSVLPSSTFSNAISSPSLAAILRQPILMGETAPRYNASVNTFAKNYLNKVPDCSSPLVAPNCVAIKNETSDVASNEDDPRTIMVLPSIKTEKVNSKYPSGEKGTQDTSLPHVLSSSSGLSDTGPHRTCETFPNEASAGDIDMPVKQECCEKPVNSPHFS